MKRHDDGFAARCTRCDVRDDVDREGPCDELGCDGTMVRSDLCDRCDEPMHDGDGPDRWVRESDTVPGVCDECLTDDEARDEAYDPDDPPLPREALA